MKQLKLRALAKSLQVFLNVRVLTFCWFSLLFASDNVFFLLYSIYYPWSFPRFSLSPPLSYSFTFSLNNSRVSCLVSWVSLANFILLAGLNLLDWILFLVQTNISRKHSSIRPKCLFIIQTFPPISRMYLVNWIARKRKPKSQLFILI